MASSKDEAKGGIVAQDEDDPELDAALSDATRFHLEITKEKNRHTEVMNSQNLGLVGSFFGDGRSLPMTMAFVALIAGAATWIGCLIAAYNDPAQADFWAKQGERALGFGGLALGYILGKAGAKGSG